MVDTDEFLAAVYTGTDRDAVCDRIFDTVARLLCDGNFAKVDEIVRRADVGRLTTFSMRSLLSITAAAKSKPPARAAFFEKVKEATTTMRGAEKAERILANLK